MVTDPPASGNDRNEIAIQPSPPKTPEAPEFCPPPLLTIDNIVNSATFLKRLLDMTKENFIGRVIGKGLRIYPQTPQAYHAIRKSIDKEVLEAYTNQLNEEKEHKAVIRGMPSDSLPQQIIEALLDITLSFITLNDCHVMTNRKTGLPMPIFLIYLSKNDANIDVYNIKELCYMKIIVETLNKKHGPALCFRCKGFFHSSKYFTRNSKCVKCGKPHLTRDCKRPSDTDATARATILPITRATRRTHSTSLHSLPKSISGKREPENEKR
ncbi:nucleic-acid-binding protein from transposon X-element [Trichonephila inaurata madagascariensis]|uniref:Nucleic-acid-binding protein from transposon X-element n=1 Tax=Trichonephila inaurata madagascariensis TaxID=2747483 RepID=A0A8X6JK51_9ARAC|nr:nucleic-acid-binding protein from transposon X-element [Trichonephila inaurata madagascariensis]